MNILTWLAGKLGGKPVPVSGTEIMDDISEYISLSGEVAYREMALWSAVNLIANAMSKCEFKTFVDHKEVKNSENYLWNISPNKNQNSSSFIQKWIATLYLRGECLIIEQSGQLLVADSFVRTPYALYDDIFTQVTVGDFTFNKSFAQSDVMYWRLANPNMRQIIEQIYNSYTKMLSYSMEAYTRSRGAKGVFYYNSLPVAGTDQRQRFDDLISTRFKQWLQADQSIIPLGDGQKLEMNTSKTYANEGTRDIREMINDISDFTAKCLCIPPALLSGKVEGIKDALESFLTFCIAPLADFLQEEINRKRYGQEGIRRGSGIKIDIRNIKHVDVLDISAAADKLISSGCYSINEIREMLGDSRIEEPWADAHYITKNYNNINAELSSFEGR